MRKAIFCLLIFIKPILSISQSNKNYEFVGTIELSTKEIITYKLNFKELDSSKIEGYTITDIFGKDKTKTKISGRLDWDKKKISFSEIENLKTLSNEAAESFCFIHLNNATIKITDEKSFIQGDFIGKFKSGEHCASGTIYLVEMDYLKKMDYKHLKKKNKNTSDTISNERKEQKIDKPKASILKNNEVLKLDWNSREIIIEIGDSRYNDGDEIAIYVNEKKILDKFVISDEKKTVIIPFTDSKEDIRIQALNEGSMKNCTSKVSIRDGQEIYEVYSYLKKNENAFISINKK